MTANVLNFHGHRRITYDTVGGCSICGGWEGEVPTDCPGREMTYGEKDDVLNGRLDFIWREGWTTFTRMDRLRVKIFCEEGRWI